MTEWVHPPSMALGGFLTPPCGLIRCSWQCSHTGQAHGDHGATGLKAPGSLPHRAGREAWNGDTPPPRCHHLPFCTEFSRKLPISQMPRENGLSVV